MSSCISNCPHPSPLPKGEGARFGYSRQSDHTKTTSLCRATGYTVWGNRFSQPRLQLCFSICRCPSRCHVEFFNTWDQHCRRGKTKRSAEYRKD